MAGSRSGMGFTLDPRAFQFNSSPRGGVRPVKVPFIGLLSASNSVTQIHGSFDTSELESYRTKGALVLLSFTIYVCVMTGLGLSQYNIQGFISPIAICLIGICEINP